MNKLKRALLAVCLVLFALSTALFAVACGEEDTPPDDGGKTTPTTYTVTLDYNKDQGTVTLSPDADSNGKYAKDSQDRV